MSRQQSLEQKRAKAAWDRVKHARAQRYAKDYSSLARSAPTEIQTNGLGQTLAFWRAKGSKNGEPKNNEHDQLFNDVSKWVKVQLSIEKDLLKWIMDDATTSDYRLATAEAIALSTWIKRFAESELPKDEMED